MNCKPSRSTNVADDLKGLPKTLVPENRPAHHDVGGKGWQEEESEVGGLRSTGWNSLMVGAWTEIVGYM